VADSIQIQPSPDDYLVIPGSKVGMINAQSSEKRLRDILGEENVSSETIYLGEGQYVQGTVLFRNTPNEVNIMWKDSSTNARPEWVRLKPAGQPQASDWLIEGGIHIGSTLQEVEKANGKPFMLSGFGWDYGGSVTDWKQGKLAFSKEGLSYLSLVFGYDPDNERQQKLAQSVMGDSEFTSSQPVMYELNPRVESITVRFK
jgi:hypothetical protein